MTRHVALIAAALLPGCAGSAGSQSAVAPARFFEEPEALGRAQVPLPTPTRSMICLTSPCIYVVSPNYGGFQENNKVTMYPADANGDVPPIHRIKGARTKMFVSSGVAVDAEHNVYVLNTDDYGSVTVYAAGSGGNVRPARYIRGPDTGMNSPYDVAVDARSNVYVANNGDDSVTVYGPKAHGDARWLQKIAGPDTGLDNVQKIALDAGENIYVANAPDGPGDGGGIITVYAAGTSGNIAPIQTIVGSNTGLGQPEGIAVDAGGNVYVANYRADSVTVFAASANGDVAPIQTISGSSTGLRNPTGVAVDSEKRIYVTNSPAFVTVYAAGANGDVAPIQKIKGEKTRLHLADAIAVR
jgi:6-phosphogluconolactonase (cycloisomerase 2 family)